MNSVLDQLIGLPSLKKYNYGQVTGVQSNGNFLIRTANNLNLSIRDDNASYSVGDNVLLAYKNNSINGAFIIKKTNAQSPSSVSNIIENGLN